MFVKLIIKVVYKKLFFVLQRVTFCTHIAANLDNIFETAKKNKQFFSHNNDVRPSYLAQNSITQST